MPNTSNQQDLDFVYDDGRFQITSEMLYTPTRFYPIANTMGKIRRDPLWFALGLTAFSALTTLVYSDLLFLNELLAIWGVTGLMQLIGVSVAFLSVDAVGHNNTMVVARTKTIRNLYLALRDARNKSKQSNIIAIEGSESE